MSEWNSRRVRGLALLVIGAIAGGSLLTGCGESGPAPVTGAHKFTIVHSQSGFGNIEPCSCNNRTTGGFPRRATLLKQLREENGVLAVDSGNSLFSESITIPGFRGQAKMKARAIAQAFVRSGLDAYVFGDLDLAAGGNFLRNLVKETGLPVLAANVIDRKTGNPVFGDYKIVQFGEVKIAVVGLVSQDLRPMVSEANEQGVKMIKAAEDARHLEEMFEDRDVKFEDPIEVITKLLPKLRSEAHLVAVLSHLPPRMAREFYQLADVDFVIGSHKPTQRAGYLIQDDMVYLSAPMSGTTLGVADFNVLDGSLVFNDQSQLNSERVVLPILREFRADIEAQYKTTDPEVIKSVDFRTGEKYVRYGEKIATYVADIEAAERNPTSSFAHRSVTLDGVEYPDDPDTKKFIRDYRQSLASLYDPSDTSRAPEIEPQPGATSFVGGCAQCHRSQHEFWLGTKHAHAWQTMLDEGAEFDLECITCHTVGYMERGGYDRPDRVGDRINVQCENCHGMGSGHSSGFGFLESETIIKYAEEMKCESCHNAEHSPDFRREIYVGRVACPPIDTRDPLIRGTYGKARRLLQERIGRKDTPLQVFMAHVDLDMRLGRFDEALEISERGLEAFVGNRMLEIGKARALDGLGRSSEALQVLLDLYARSESDPVTLKELINLLLHATDPSVRDVAAADAYIEWGLSQYGKTDVVFLRYHAESRHSKGEIYMAITVLQDAISKANGRGARNIETLAGWIAERDAREEYEAPPPLPLPPMKGP